MKNILIFAVAVNLLFSACANSPTAQNSAANSVNRINSTETNRTSDDGLETVKSQNSFVETYSKLKSAIEKNDQLKIIVEVNHAENAEKAGLTLRPTRLIIFGNPKLGTPLMNEAQTLAIDLPQKFLIYEDEKREVFVAFNDPLYLAKRHDISESREEFSKISAALKTLAEAATGK